MYFIIRSNEKWRQEAIEHGFNSIVRKKLFLSGNNLFSPDFLLLLTFVELIEVVRIDRTRYRKSRFSDGIFFLLLEKYEPLSQETFAQWIFFSHSSFGDIFTWIRALIYRFYSHSVQFIKWTLSQMKKNTGHLPKLRTELNWKTIVFLYSNDTQRCDNWTPELAQYQHETWNENVRIRMVRINSRIFLSWIVDSYACQQFWLFVDGMAKWK